jgi:hypothetical protein
VFTRALVPALARTDAHLAEIGIDMREDVARLAASIAVLIYSSGPNEAAQDGTGALSPFTDAFVRHFRAPCLGFSDAFARVRRDVSAETKKAQNEILYGSVPASLLSP